jgi:hypothetical protein
LIVVFCNGAGGRSLDVFGPTVTASGRAWVWEAGPGEAGDEVPDFGQGERYEAFRPGSGAPFLALTVVRKAWASMDRVMWEFGRIGQVAAGQQPVLDRAVFGAVDPYSRPGVMADPLGSVTG